MEKVIIGEEKAKECRCVTCPTFTMNKLKGHPFCGNGPSTKEFEEHNGCECQICPVRLEGGLDKAHPISVLYCKAVVMTEPVRNLEKPEAVIDVDLTVDPVHAGGGAAKLG